MHSINYNCTAYYPLYSNPTAVVRVPTKQLQSRLLTHLKIFQKLGGEISLKEIFIVHEL